MTETKYFKKEIYNNWNMTEEQAFAEAEKITVKGLRLTFDEKMTLLYEAKELL